MEQISPGGYFRNFWVGMYRWDPGTLNLYPPYPRVAVFQKLLGSLAQSSQNKTLYHNPQTL